MGLNLKLLTNLKLRKESKDITPNEEAEYYDSIFYLRKNDFLFNQSYGMVDGFYDV